MNEEILSLINRRENQILVMAAIYKNGSREPLALAMGMKA